MVSDPRMLQLGQITSMRFDSQVFKVDKNLMQSRE
ncbi:hypothetical protein B6N60_00187 [Richelia sinica FACHB-800]|uniref:Uncharacterized protein n=1 Tax=Richelia sinica FACHB-800 TaxID=1357546 RepID=A0A975Y2W1_9NOST|nr:hypothetical protein B6N60_00187 [Richelia sinica FACHB-800]